MGKKSKTIIFIGWLGTALLIVVYALNSFGVIESQGFWYPVMNLLAALLLGIRVFADRNYSNLILEIFWGGVAIIALVNYLV